MEQMARQDQSYGGRSAEEAPFRSRGQGGSSGQLGNLNFARNLQPLSFKDYTINFETLSAHRRYDGRIFVCLLCCASSLSLRTRTDYGLRPLCLFRKGICQPVRLQAEAFQLLRLSSFGCIGRSRRIIRAITLKYVVHSMIIASDETSDAAC